MIHEIAWTAGSELVGELGQALNNIKSSLGLSDDNEKHRREATGMVKRIWPEFPGQQRPDKSPADLCRWPHKI